MPAPVLQIEQFDPVADAARLACCREIAAACERADDPDLPRHSPARFDAWWTGGSGEDPRECWLAAAADGSPAGCYLLILPVRENTAIASCDLYVRPGARRSGHGSGLLAHCATQARAAGRFRLSAEVRDGSAGAAFAGAAGAASGITEVYRRLVVDERLRARLPSLRTAAERHAAGYTLVAWAGLTPGEHMPGKIALEEAMADSPQDEGVEAEIWDEDRVRTFEQAAIERGQQLYSIAARHDQTGQLVAITQLSTDPGNPGWALQAITAVARAHRGRRLGLLVKVAMLDWLTSERPDVERIVTGNAGPNDHMIAINEQLGFEVVSVRRRWELTLALADS